MKSSEQIAELSRLSQQAAAHLVGITARQLRDGDAPRNPDGTYDGRELLDWLTRRRARQNRPELSEDEVERLLNAADEATPQGDCPRMVLADLLRDLHDRAGDAGLALFGAAWLHQWDELVEKQRAENDEAIAEADPEERAFMRLSYGVMCRCGRVRHGWRWAKAKKPRFAIEGTCDRCVSQEGET